MSVLIKAKPEDIPRMASGARMFCDLLRWPLNEAGYLAFLKKFAERSDAVVFLMQNGDTIAGGIGGELKIDPISGRTLLVEMFWFVLPEFRGTTIGLRLLANFEKWGKDHGAAHTCMIAMENSMPQEMDRLYRRIGYRKLETTYVK